uniref:FadB n=1 Tax=Rhizobium leguminosarum bv. trifolii TaxID=386 RepID=Q93E13_RHILT|nr:FadB [Rhizobium leguminosarum bv. trifolii]
MLTEVILGSDTGDRALAVALDYVAAIKKTPIVVNDTRGFFVNRCVLRYMSESYDMLIEGVPPVMIENAAKMAGMPVGPLALNDEVAIDLSLKILKATVADLGEKAIDPRHMELISRMVEKEGRFGRKNSASRSLPRSTSMPVRRTSTSGPSPPNAHSHIRPGGKSSGPFTAIM